MVMMMFYGCIVAVKEVSYDVSVGFGKAERSHGHSEVSHSKGKPVCGAI